MAANHDSLWYLDNGASNHMTGNRSFFTDLNENITGNVHSGKESSIQINGKGTIIFHLQNGEQTFIVSEVYYTPNLQLNILSLGLLSQTGCRAIMHNEYLCLYDANGSLLMKASRSSDHLYKITLQTAPVHVTNNVINAKMESVRLILALAAREQWEVHHLDVKSAFFSTLDKALKETGFVTCARDHAVYKRDVEKTKTKTKTKTTLVVGVCENDVIVTGNNRKAIFKFKEQMRGEFGVSDMGLLASYRGIEVVQSKDGIKLKQSGYAKKILQETRMYECECYPSKYPMKPKLVVSNDESGALVNKSDYRSIIGNLEHLTHTRPDINYAVEMVSRYTEAPKRSHLEAVKRILRYVKETEDYGLEYGRTGENRLVCYSDSSHGTNQSLRNDGKSTTGMVFYLGDAPVAWCTEKQRIVARTPCEAEFIAASETARQAVRLQGLLEELTGRKAEKVRMLVDNAPAIALMKNPGCHESIKHIDAKYYFIQECVENGEVIVEQVFGQAQRAHVLTKALPSVKFAEMRELLGVKDLRGTSQN